MTAMAGGPPTMSIVTISFNQADFLERAIRSVIDQPGVDVDYIVVDPGSTDGSRDIIDRYRDRITTVLLEPDSGPADGLNKGLARARGSWFAYLNSDDEYLPGAFADVMTVLQAHPAADVVYGNGWSVDADGRRLKHLIPSRRFSAAGYARGLSLIVQQASFMRTAALRAVGGFNADNSTCWDGEAFFEMARRGARFRRVDRDWALFRLHAQSITGSGSLAARYHRDQQRIFAAQFGRAPGAADQAIARTLRLVDRITDPVGMLRKIGDRLPRPGRRA